MQGASRAAVNSSSIARQNARISRAASGTNTAMYSTVLDSGACKQDRPSSRVLKALAGPKPKCSQGKETQQQQGGKNQQDPLQDATNGINVRGFAGYPIAASQHELNTLLPPPALQQQQQQQRQLPHRQQRQQQSLQQHQEGPSHQQQQQQTLQQQRWQPPGQQQQQTLQEQQQRASLQQQQQCQETQQQHGHQRQAQHATLEEQIPLQQPEPTGASSLQHTDQAAIQQQLQCLEEQFYYLKLKFNTTLQNHRATCTARAQTSSPEAARDPAMIPFHAVQSQPTTERACSPVAPSPWLLSRCTSLQQTAACQAVEAVLSSDGGPSEVPEARGSSHSKQLLYPFLAKPREAPAQCCKPSAHAAGLQCLSPSLAASNDGSARSFSLSCSPVKESSPAAKQTSAHQTCLWNAAIGAPHEPQQQQHQSYDKLARLADVSGENDAQQQQLEQWRQQEQPQPRLGTCGGIQQQQEGQEQFSSYTEHNILANPGPNKDQQQVYGEQWEQAKAPWKEQRGASQAHHAPGRNKGAECLHVPIGHPSAISCTTDVRSSQSGLSYWGASLCSFTAKEDSQPGGSQGEQEAAQQDVVGKGVAGQLAQGPESLQQLAALLVDPQGPFGCMGTRDQSQAQAPVNLSEGKHAGQGLGGVFEACGGPQLEPAQLQQQKQKKRLSGAEASKRSHMEVYQQEQERAWDPQELQQCLNVQHSLADARMPLRACSSPNPQSQGGAAQYQQPGQAAQPHYNLHRDLQEQPIYAAAIAQCSGDQHQSAACKYQEAVPSKEPAVSTPQSALDRLDASNKSLLASAAALIEAGQQKWQRLRAYHLSRMGNGSYRTPSRHSCSSSIHQPVPSRTPLKDSAGHALADLGSSPRWQPRAMEASGSSSSCKQPFSLHPSPLRTSSSRQQQQQQPLCLEQLLSNPRRIGALDLEFTWPTSPEGYSPALSCQQFFSPFPSSTKGAASVRTAALSSHRQRRTPANPSPPPELSPQRTHLRCRTQERFHTPLSRPQRRSPGWPLPVGQYSSWRRTEDSWCRSGQPKDLSSALRDAGASAGSPKGKAAGAPAAATTAKAGADAFSTGGTAAHAASKLAGTEAVSLGRSRATCLSSGKAEHIKPNKEEALLMHREQAAGMCSDLSSPSSSSTGAAWRSPLPSPGCCYSAGSSPVELATGLLKGSGILCAQRTTALLCTPPHDTGAVGMPAGAWTVHTNLLARPIGEPVESTDQSLKAGGLTRGGDTALTWSRDDLRQKEGWNPCSSSSTNSPPMTGVVMRTWETSAAKATRPVGADNVH